MPLLSQVFTETKSLLSFGDLIPLAILLRSQSAARPCSWHLGLGQLKNKSVTGEQQIAFTL